MTLLFTFCKTANSSLHLFKVFVCAFCKAENPGSNVNIEVLSVWTSDTCKAIRVCMLVSGNRWWDTCRNGSDVSREAFFLWNLEVCLRTVCVHL